MKKRYKPLLSELLWLVVVLVITLLICRFAFVWDYRRGTVDLHLHDTYFVLSAATAIIPIFLLITFLLYFLKEFRYRFSRTLPNIILFVAGILLVGLLVFINQEIGKLQTRTGGWTMYPPQEESRNIEPDSLLEGVTHVFTALQVVVTIALLYAAFQWWKKLNKTM